MTDNINHEQGWFGKLRDRCGVLIFGFGLFSLFVNFITFSDFAKWIVTNLDQIGALLVDRILLGFAFLRIPMSETFVGLGMAIVPPVLLYSSALRREGEGRSHRLPLTIAMMGATFYVVHVGLSTAGALPTAEGELNLWERLRVYGTLQGIALFMAACFVWGIASAKDWQKGKSQPRLTEPTAWQLPEPPTKEKLQSLIRKAILPTVLIAGLLWWGVDTLGRAGYSPSLVNIAAFLWPTVYLVGFVIVPISFIDAHRLLHRLKWSLVVLAALVGATLFGDLIAAVIPELDPTGG